MFDKWRLPMLAASVLAIAGLAACGGDGGGEDAEAAEAVVRSAAERYNARDADGFYALFTDKGLKELFGPEAPPDINEAKQAFRGFIGEDPLTVRELDAEVDDDTATVEAMTESGGTLDGETFTLIKSGNDWKIDGYRDYSVSPDVPDGYTEVDLALKDFSFDLDPADVKTGKLAFVSKNEGKQPHEVVFVKLGEGVNLQQALQSEGPPEGIELLGRIEQQPDGDEYNMVMLRDVTAGRYALVCFFPDTSDPQQTPHAFKGMVREFTVR